MGAEQSNETLMCTEPKDDGIYYYARFDNKPFDKGACRYAYKGKLLCNSDKRSTARHYDSSVVVKVFIKKEHARDYGAWNADISASKKANELAALFNLHKFIDRSLYFPIPTIAKMDRKAAYLYLGLFEHAYDMSTNPVGSNEYVAMEEYLPGNYKKFSNNNGFVNNEVNSSTMSAFSHWTFHQSNGAVLVCDLQGVFDGHEYRLTDPAINSTVKNTYGATDCGVLGQGAFFQTHQCNSICRGWKKLKVTNELANEVSKIPKTGHTVYTFQLPNGIKTNRNQFGNLPIIAE
jgi:hypothetical protein